MDVPSYGTAVVEFDGERASGPSTRGDGVFIYLADGRVFFGGYDYVSFKMGVARGPLLNEPDLVTLLLAKKLSRDALVRRIRSISWPWSVRLGCHP
jgi:hypothetical protein